jgi:anti-sigma B factor antagonist
VTELARVEASSADGTQVVRIAGEIDLSNATRVRDAIVEATPDVPMVVLDLTAVEYLDSAGIAMLFRLAERLGYHRQELRLVVPPDALIRGVIRLTRLDQVVSVTDSIA